MNNYIRPRGGFLSTFLSHSPMVKMLLYANVGVFLFEQFFGGLRIGVVSLEAYIQSFLYLYPPGSSNFFPWQLFTYMFLHGGFMHILFNMLALVIFGPALEVTWGGKKFLIYYLICGLGGGLAHVVISPLIAGGAAPLVGASGAIFGLLAAFGFMFPDQILLFNFFIPMKAKYAVLFYILLELISVPSQDGIGHLAHLGGAVVGIVFLLVKREGVGVFRKKSSMQNPWQNPMQSFGKRRTNDGMLDADYEEIGSTRTTTATKTQGGQRIITQEDIDHILDKIASSGYEKLTEEEREILMEASRKMDARQ